jgi:hypothetical protein
MRCPISREGVSRGPEMRNQVCSGPFLPFRNGQIYQIDRRDAGPRTLPGRELGDEKHSWLCDVGSAKLKTAVLADSSAAVEDAYPSLRGKQFGRLPFLLTRADINPIGPRPQQTSENSLTDDCSRHAECTPRILILDVELKTLGLVEQALRDSGFCAITTTNVAEAISLLATGFFDLFIAIDYPARLHAVATLNVLANARIRSLRFVIRMNKRFPRGDINLPYGTPRIENCLRRKPRSDDFFCTLPKEAWEAFNQIKHLVALPEGAIILVEGQPSRGVFMLCQRRAKVSTS